MNASSRDDAELDLEAALERGVARWRAGGPSTSVLHARYGPEKVES